MHLPGVIVPWGLMLKFTVQGTLHGLMNLRLALTAASTLTPLPTGAWSAAAAPDAGTASVLSFLPPLDPFPPVPAAFAAPAPGVGASGRLAITVPKLKTLSFRPKLLLTGLKGSRWLRTTCSSKIAPRFPASMPDQLGKE